MEIQAFTVTDLKEALLSDNFWLTETLPITKHRARSFSQNPRADGNDLVLLIAYRDNRVIGYLGILPDTIFANDTAYKIGWLTSWWVDPGFKTTGVGAILLFRALGAYQQRLGVSGGSKEATIVLSASQKFIALKSLRGLDIRLRFNTTKAIVRTHPAMGIFRALFKIFDTLADEIVHLRSFFWKRRNGILRRLTFEYISCIDEEADRFIQIHHRQDLTRRGKDDLDWIMNYPWVLSAPLKDSASRRYYFSSLSGRFMYLAVKVFERNNGMIGFLMLKVRDDRMSVVYSHFENRHASSIITAVAYHALTMDVSILSLYDERLVTGFSELRCPHWSAEKASKGFLVSKAFADTPLAACRLHGGDGDLVFY